MTLMTLIIIDVELGESKSWQLISVPFRASVTGLRDNVDARGEVETLEMVSVVELI